MKHHRFSYHKKTHSRKHHKKTYRHHRKGGAGAPNPSSYSDAASFGLAVNGPLDTQIANSLTSAGLNGQSQSTQSVGLQGQNVGIASNQLFKMNGGMHKGYRHHRSKRHKRGGVWTTILSQAAAPLTLLGLQQSYKRKHK